MVVCAVPRPAERLAAAGTSALWELGTDLCVDKMRGKKNMRFCFYFSGLTSSLCIQNIYMGMKMNFKAGGRLKVYYATGCFVYVNRL